MSGFWRAWSSALLIGWLCMAGVRAAEPAKVTSHSIEQDKRALGRWQSYVGEWRGVGLPKRGSNQGAWTEDCVWAWHFDQGRAELVADFEHNKFFDRLRLQPGDADGQFVALASSQKTPDAAPTRYVGKPADGGLVLTADRVPEGAPARITLRLVAGGDRLVTLFEKRNNGDTFARLAEVGATRQGSDFAKNAAGGPECVVTGGLGTIAVKHEGKTYYVCCSGCRELFEDDPAGVLADYYQRKKDEQTKGK